MTIAKETIFKKTPELFIAGLCALKSENAKSAGNTRDRRRRIVDRERLKCADTIHSNAKIYIYFFSNKICGISRSYQTAVGNTVTV